MKAHISLLGLTVLLSATAFGQDPPRRNPATSSRFTDPFDAMERWPDASVPREQSDHETAQTVAVKNLEHKIPKAAQNEYKKAAEAFKKNDWLLAKQHLERAIKIDPQFANAHNDLGVALARLGQTNPAIAESLS